MKEIKEGDYVEVTWDGSEGVEQVKGIVKSRPSETGDMWYVKVTSPPVAEGIWAINPNSSTLSHIRKVVEQK